MLVLGRRAGQGIVIELEDGRRIGVMQLSEKRGGSRIGVTADEGIKVHRLEVFEEILREREQLKAAQTETTVTRPGGEIGSAA